MPLLTEQHEVEDLQRSLAETREPVVFDIETTYVDRYQDRHLIGLGIWCNDTPFYIPVAHKSSVGETVRNLKIPRDFLLGVQSDLLAHNAVFDIIGLDRAGIDVPRDNIYCTQMESHVHNEDYLAGHGLDVVGKRYCGVEASKEKDQARRMKKWGWDSTPPQVMYRYVTQDVRIPAMIHNVLKPQLDLEYYARNRRIMFVIEKMIKKGIPLDVERCRDFERQCTIQLADVINQIGFDPGKLGDARKRLFSPAPIGLGLEATHTTPTGLAQINDDFLRSCNHPIAGLIRQHNHIRKELTAYYSSYLKFADEDYPRIHAGFKQHGAVTGRWSCAEPNLHQIPREGTSEHIKKLFLAEEGKQLWEIDYSNIEWRMALAYSQDPTLAALIDSDMHMYVANQLKVSRQDAKIGGFTYLFAGGYKAIMEQLGIPEKEARAFIKGMKELFVVLEQTKNAATKVAESKGWINVWTGRKRHFNDRRQAYTAFNMLTQGGSFEIVQESLLKLDEAGFDIRNCVHDSVWLMVDNESEVKEAEHIMTSWIEPSFGIRFPVESKRLN